MFLGIEHGGYIFFSYGFTALVFAGLIFWILSNLKRQEKRLASLEASGASRRRKRKSSKANKEGS